MKIISAAFLLFLVMDPVGNVPIFLATLKQVEPARRRKVVLRELLIALLVLVFFLFFGRSVLAALQVSQPALTIAGGIVLFLIAIRMIFSISGDEMFGRNPQGEPFIVPLAIPLVAGPSAITTVLLLTSRDPGYWVHWLLALVAAWVASALILLGASSLAHYLGERVLMALERLMGMLLTIIAVEMFLSGVKRFWGG